MTAQYAHPDSLVDTQWVADNLGKAGIVLAEVDVDTSAYDSGHVEGSLGWNWQTDLQNTLTRDLLTSNEVADLLGRSGISNDTTIVLYGDNNNWFAAWAFWFLRMYGHQNVKLMNGGRVKWVAEGRSITNDVTSPTAVSYSASAADSSLRALRDTVLAAASAGGTQLVDVRSPAEYNGEVIAPENMPQEGAQRSGHIPGAASIPWLTTINDDGTFKSADELGDIYGPKGIDGGTDVITYCRIGERSAHSWFALTQLLGYDNVSNYDGSWTEYGSLVGAPIEK
jgi:thiosulfate/3-mercaptopyruvate sulfurtransferase